MPPPDQFAILLILSAAFLHALWNAVVKGAPDRGAAIGMIALGTSMVGLLLVPFVEPPATVSWLYMFLSLAIHIFYFSFLILAYRLGDFSQVYPIARGVAPLLVAIGAIVFIGETLTLLGWAGLLTICLAIGLLVFAGGKLPAAQWAVGAALLTGVCIAGYTLTDGIGVRLSGTQAGYIAWKFSLQMLLGFGFLFWRRAYLAELKARDWAAGLLGGFVSGIAYALAIYAMSLTTLGSVSAIRESSVIIAALIGAIWFGERPWLPRLFAACLVVLGVVLLASG